jgi:hypothetical protein
MPRVSAKDEVEPMLLGMAATSVLWGCVLVGMRKEVFEREYLLSRDTAYWEQLCTPPVRAGEEPRLPDPNCANNRKLEMELILSGGWYGVIFGMYTFFHALWLMSVIVSPRIASVRVVAMSRLGMGALAFLYFLIVASSGYSQMSACTYLTFSIMAVPEILLLRRFRTAIQRDFLSQQTEGPMHFAGPGSGAPFAGSVPTGPQGQPLDLGGFQQFQPR